MKNYLDANINNLPKRYHFAYKYCEFLYNNLVSTYNGLKQNKMFGHTVKFKNNKELKRFFKVNMGEFVDKLLKSKHYKTDAFLIVYKRLVEALLFDYITFMSEVLTNVLKGNLAISYTLLRKPFKEILTLFEIMCKDPVIFFKDFWLKDSTNFAIDKISNETKKSNIIEVVKIIDLVGIHIPEVIYDLRFNRFHDLSYEILWNKALHLFTTRNNITTENRNINFIFAGKAENESMLHHIFFSLPMILKYTNDVVEMLVSFFARYNDNYATRRMFGYFAWSYEFHISNESKSKIRKLLSNPFKDAKCPKCKKKLNFNKLSLIEYCLEESISCQKCDFKIKGLNLSILEKNNSLHPIFR